MKTVCKLIGAAALVFSTAAWPAAGSGKPMLHANVDVSNTRSLQRGARLFVNYCLSCHSAAYSRYNRVAKDLGISEENMRENLIFTGRKFGDTMTVAMTTAQGKEWFGAPPPDLSVRARSRGADWIYTFLKSYYVDDKATRGVNNLLFPGTSMPHVLWELQGLQALNKDSGDQQDAHGKGDHSPFTLVVPGRLTPAEYDKAITDLVNFLVYLGEPAQLSRKSVGVGVLFFLATLGIVAYFMKRDYWKDIH